MKNLLPALLASVAFAIAPLYGTAPQGATTFYVSPGGDDANAGTSIDKPFRTIAKARDAVRASRTAGAKGPATVELLPGIYPMSESLALGPEDSGTAGNPVTYRSHEPRTAVLTGARIFKLTDFKPVTDPAILDRLDPAARANVRTLSIKDAGLVDGGPFPDVFGDRGGIFEMFDAQGRMPLSRWPNKGYTTMSKVLTIGDKSVPGVFEYRDDRPSRWLNNENVWLKGQWRVGWEDPAIKVAKIDPASKTIAFAAGLPNGIGSKYHRPTDGSPIGSGQEPWCAINLPEEIDTPGEWAIDFKTGTLFVWPRSTDPASEIVITQLTAPLISANGTQNVAIEGLVLEHSLGDGIVMEGAQDCLVAGCIVRDLAGRGIVVNGVKTGVLSCDVYNVGEGAVYISGGDRKTLAKSGNFVINNHLYNYGILKHQYSAGVHVGALANPVNPSAVRDAVGMTISHNVIHHAPRDAFLYSGNDNVYEFNEVYYCAYDTKDTGAFYSWLDWTMRGNIIRNNFIHDTVGGVNPDDGASGNTVYGNIFAGPRIGVWIASGPDNKVRNNIFVKDSGSVFGMDDRGVSRGYATNKRLIGRVGEINPGEEPWKSAHPEVATMLENRPELPWRTEFVGNLIVSKNPAPSEIKIKPEFRSNPEIILEKDNVTVTDDPGFANPAAKDYSLPADLPLLKSIPGFEPIPFEKIGLYIDAYRPVLPTEKERQRSPADSPYAEDQDKNYGT